MSLSTLCSSMTSRFNWKKWSLTVIKMFTRSEGMLERFPKSLGLRGWHQNILNHLMTNIVFPPSLKRATETPQMTPQIELSGPHVPSSFLPDRWSHEHLRCFCLVNSDVKCPKIELWVRNAWSTVKTVSLAFQPCAHAVCDRKLLEYWHLVYRDCRSHYLFWMRREDGIFPHTPGCLRPAILVMTNFTLHRAVIFYVGSPSGLKYQCVFLED